MLSLADRHYEAMEGMSDGEVVAYAKTVIDAATIVFGTYPDAGSPDGVGMYIIKGKRELASGRSDQCPTTAIPLPRTRTGKLRQKKCSATALEAEITDTAPGSTASSAHMPPLKSVWRCAAACSCCRNPKGTRP
jgi:hypothetical protein